MRTVDAGYKMCPLLAAGKTNWIACEGQSCAMWRWYQVYDIGGYEGNLSKEQGYCGLSGPQPGHRVYKREEPK